MMGQEDLAHYEDCCTAAALYSLGALPPDEERRFAQRLASGCPLCTAEAAQAAEVANYLTMSLEPEQPPPSVRERLMRRIEALSPDKGFSKQMKLVRESDSPWVSSPMPGVDMRLLLGYRTVLIRMQAGAVYPTHEHKRAEQCYVLEGTITDSDGVTAGPGDFVHMAAGTTHHPIRTETGCVFLITYV
jgi:anti-sigma factor ChrR (cupin superfamily)